VKTLIADNKAVLEQKVAILKGLAHPVRLSIVEALADSEMCVCDIAEMFHFDRTTISKHLALMKNLGILEDRKEGLKVYYSLRIRCLPSMLSCIEKVVEGNDPERVFIMGCCEK
jgi:ArsR family transcriptional regulator